MDFGKKVHKMNQLKKRLKRSRDNEGHSDEVRDTIRLKRVKELQKELGKIWKPKKE
jgi:CRISPR/Cas system CMR subunit Cmr6 (Cas7 group RAMP superfamily)